MTLKNREFPPKQQWVAVPCKYKQFRCYLMGTFSAVNDVNRPERFSEGSNHVLWVGSTSKQLYAASGLREILIYGVKYTARVFPYDPAMFHFIICSKCPRLATSIGRDNLAYVARPKSVTCPNAAEVSRGSQAVRGIYVFTEEFKREKHASAHLQSKALHHVNLSATALHIFLSLLQHLLFYYRSHPLLPHPGLVRPPQVFPILISVQRQGTGSRPWLDFHTVPSTERHIELIRANKCGGAPISLARPGSGHTDGLV